MVFPKKKLYFFLFETLFKKKKHEKTTQIM